MQYIKTSVSPGYSNLLATGKTTQVNSQKMWYLLKNSQALKKGAALYKMASMKKLWNTSGSQEIAVMVGLWQNINYNDAGEFLQIPSEAGLRQHKFSWIVVI